jgi:hypothetical protein
MKQIVYMKLKFLELKYNRLNQFQLKMNPKFRRTVEYIRILCTFASGKSYTTSSC